MTKISTTGYNFDSEDRHEPSLIIPSNQITMNKVKHRVYGIDNYGHQQMMYPGHDYTFPGQYVYEIPMAQVGLSVPSSTPFGHKVEDFKKKWEKPTKLSAPDERTNPTVEAETDLSASYRREMGEATTRGIQAKLKQYDPSLEVDGVWGPLTEAAYRKYWNLHLGNKKVAAERNRFQQGYTPEQNTMPVDVPRAAMAQYYADKARSAGNSVSNYMDYERNWNFNKNAQNVPTAENLRDQAAQIAQSNNISSEGSPAIDFYNKENPITGKPLSKYSEDELVDFIQNNGSVIKGNQTLSPGSDERMSYQKDISRDEDHSMWDYAKHYYDILSDPFKAARMSKTEQHNPFGDFMMNVPDVPWGFYHAQENPNTGSADLVGSGLLAANPLTYVNAAGRLVEDAVQPESYFDLANLAGAAGKSFLGVVSGDDIPISAQQKESALRGIGTASDILTVAPIAPQVKPFIKGFAKGSIPAALQRFSSYAVTPTTSLTQFEKSSLNSLKKSFNILAQNKIGSGPGVSKSTMKMIVSDPKLLMDFQAAVRELHPNVVRKLIGNKNFDEFSHYFPTSTKGMGVEELSKLEKIGLGLQSKGFMSPKKPSAAELNDPAFLAGYSLIKPSSFTENFELEKLATTLVPQMHATDKNVVSKLRDAFNKLDSAEPGELFVGSSNMSVDSYAITNNRLMSSIKDGSVKIHDIKMAPLNNQGTATATENPSFFKAALKQVNEEIDNLSKKINENLPKAYFDPNTSRIIAPYVVVEKVAPAKLIRAQVKVKTPSGIEKEIRYVKPDLSDLKPNETLIKQLPKDYNPRYTGNSPDKFSKGGQSHRYVNSYNDFINIWHS